MFILELIDYIVIFSKKMASTVSVFSLLLVVMSCHVGSSYIDPKVLKDGQSCITNCQLIPHERDFVYAKFKRHVNNPVILVIYFNIIKDGIPLYNSSDSAYLYAWSRGFSGKQLFSKPLEYISAYFYLPLIFHHKMDMEVTESQSGCLSLVNQTCHQYIIVQTLVNITRIDQCRRNNCDSICYRRFANSGRLGYQQEYYACCQHQPFLKKFNFSSCLQEELSSIHWIFSFQITIASIIVAFSLLFYLASWCIRWHGR